MRPADIGPVAPAERTQSALDLFFIFAAANIVATTLQVGASLGLGLDLTSALVLIAIGAVAGSALVAALVPLGPRLGTPSVITARAALGIRGASLVSVFLYLTNFAWIAINNVIAASVCARLLGGPSAMRFWVVGLGALSTVIVARGPRAVTLADRVAVPLLVVVGSLVTVAVLPVRVGSALPQIDSLSWSRGLDIVIGYQVSWILMFADYSRYTANGRRSAVAAFLGLALTSLWLMPVGMLAARAAATSDPGAMLAAIGVGWWGAALMAIATVTTNFVNLYMSSLAWKSLVPRAGDQTTIWITGAIGTALGLVSDVWLDRYADFMLLIGGTLVPVGGVLIAHFFGGGRSTSVHDLYDPSGPYGRNGGWLMPGLVAWGGGVVVYYAASSWGSTLPALVTSVVVYWILAKKQ